MNLGHVWTLIKTEVFHGPKDVILVIAVLLPILLALFVNLAFGNIFTDRAKLGVFDENHSQLPAILSSAQSIVYRSYDSDAGLRAAAANGSIDMGIVLPAGFDTALSTGTVKLKAYIWGESLAKNRAVIPAVLVDAVHTVVGTPVPMNIETLALGDEASLPWSDRLLPLTVLMAVFWGGMMLPASSIINEKQRHTLEALSVTPATIGDIFTAKGVIGAVLAIVMGVLTLALSGNFGGSAPALMLVLGLGAVMAAEVGLMSGALIRDMNTLFATWKFGGLLLFGPAIVYMFPQIPAWVGYLFPTYYVIRPVVDLSISGLGFSSVVLYVAVEAVIVAVMVAAIVATVRRLSTRALRLNG